MCVPASSKVTLFCGIKEVRFFPTAEMNQHFLTPKPLTVIEGDGYTPTENWISMLHYYIKTAGVRSRESVCRLIELAMDEMIAWALHAGSLGNLSIALVISITGNAHHCSSTDGHHLQGICITIFSSGKALEVNYRHGHLRAKTGFKLLLWQVPLASRSYFKLFSIYCSSGSINFDLFLFFPQQVTEAPDWNKVNICILMICSFCCPTGTLHWPIGIFSSLICIQKVTGLLVH